MDLTVSIVNWNTASELRGCLESVLGQGGSISFEVIVVDNASSNGSAQMVASEFGDRVRLITNGTNLGFGAAQNQAMKMSHGRCVLLLNPDCRLLSDDVMERMMRFMDDNADVGMLGPKILNPDGSLQYSARRFPTMFAAVFRHTLLGKLFPNNRFVRDYMMTDWDHNETRDVDWLSGSALMVRREMFESIGLLDERFFMYLEDVDWCKRAHSGGWRVVYFPMVAVSHRIGSASDQNPIEMIKQHHASMMKYYLKHDGRTPKILLAPLVMLGLRLRTRARIKMGKLG
ncbi:MAG: hypothetical protein A2Z18_04225 [Armatimonadetes bacterium RBG_16_58_9]|nr:MAG: hypothetical protein A2Z18_04225 [Armatimonadetes bacterium RBG_16_58_9]